MTAINYDQFCAIERTVSTVSNAVRMTATKDVSENIRTAEYLMSVIRSHAHTMKNGFESEADRAEWLESLYSGLYR